MILVFFFVSLLLSSLPFLHSATYQNTSMPNCPESFNCPDFGLFKYPFYKATDTNCGGLIKINCTSNHENVEIGGQSYEITQKFGSGPSIVIRNRTFQNLVESNSCEALMNNFTSPTPLLFNISIYPIMTLFKCTKDPKYAAAVKVYFDQPNYISYDGCKDHNFYYQHPIINTTVPSDLPPTCEVIQLPAMVNWTEGHQAPDYSNIFSLLTPMFSIMFKSPSCDKCLTKHSFSCMGDWNFQCSDDKNDKPVKKPIILILVLAGSAAFILVLSSVVFIIWRHYNKNLFPYVSSKDNTPDIEDTNFFFGVSIFSYTELKDATQNFNPSQELGDGGFGAVYYGKLQDGREVAVKRLHEHNYKRVQQFINEVEILTNLCHPNLVMLYGCTSQQSHELLLVYEYIPNGTVADHLHGKRANSSLLTWPIRMNIAIETASALAYLHASEIIHRDVKTNNILLDHNFCVKVADFGLSRPLPNDVTHVSTAPQGTPGYLDPQYHQCYQLTDKSDVYSFGVVLIELISSMVAVDLSRSQNEISLANLAINRIQQCALDQLIDPVLGSDMNAEYMRMITSVAELAFQCLQFDSEMRPKMNEVLDVLEDIQAEGRIYSRESISELKTIKASPPSENNDAVVLLKDFMCSPVSVAGEWQSDSSGSTTLTISGNRLPMKNSISN